MPGKTFFDTNILVYAVDDDSPMPPLAAKTVLNTFSVFEIVQVTPALIQNAIDCAVLNAMSFWDSLIVAAAASAGCTRVYTEDLNAGQSVLGVTIENPLV
ncbi:MAG: PIN domain-containing protein [Gemmatimonadaceae bacterium]